jgi:hypothetical protein
MESKPRSLERALAELTKRLEQLPPGHSFRPALVRKIAMLQAELELRKNKSPAGT